VGAGGFIARLPHDGTAAERLPYAGFDGLVSMQRAATDRLLLFGEAGVRDFSLPETP